MRDQQPGRAAVWRDGTRAPWLFIELDEDMTGARPGLCTL
ncbi:hypothetical protein SNL152K_1248 [Streptomyces sp. NL15-2K]|nr:hypothetical protein SNL152K_1248 [Streptomyces sp. NL15-2K]